MVVTTRHDSQTPVGGAQVTERATGEQYPRLVFVCSKKSSLGLGVDPAAPRVWRATSYSPEDWAVWLQARQ